MHELYINIIWLLVDIFSLVSNSSSHLLFYIAENYEAVLMQYYAAGLLAVARYLYSTFFLVEHYGIKHILYFPLLNNDFHWLCIYCLLPFTSFYQLLGKVISILAPFPPVLTNSQKYDYHNYLFMGNSIFIMRYSILKVSTIFIPILYQS